MNPLKAWRPKECKGEKKEHWMELCAQAAVEQDPEKLHALVEEIERLLQEKEDRLKKVPILLQVLPRVKARPYLDRYFQPRLTSYDVG